MMTLCARLCALCAVCALMQMAMPRQWESESIRMIGGMLMLHLVLGESKTLIEKILLEKDLMRIFQILME